MCTLKCRMLTVMMHDTAGQPQVACVLWGMWMGHLQHECVRTLSLMHRGMGKLAKKMLWLGATYIYSGPCAPTLMWPSFCPQLPIDPAHYSNDGNTPTDKTFSPKFPTTWVCPSGYVQVASMPARRRVVVHTSPSCWHWCNFNPGRMPLISWVAHQGISVGRGENACAHSPSCQHWCNVEHRSWPILEGHLGHGDPGWLSLPAVPPQLHL